jgi:anti-anti-sigma factor
MQSAVAPLNIAGEQTIRTVDELHKALTEYLDRGPDVVLDLSEVEACDAAALQLVYALRQSAAERKQRFHLKAVSQAVCDTAAALGLSLEGLMAPCEFEVARSDDGI